MRLTGIAFANHPFLKDLTINFVDSKTGMPYPVVVFVGENGSGKTTLLSQLLDYSRSSFIKNKQSNTNIFGDTNFNGVFLRQNILYSSAQNEINRVIKGGPDIYPSLANVFSSNHNIHNLRTNMAINSFEQSKDVLGMFNDEIILNAYINNELDGIKCGGEVLKSMDGSSSSINLDSLSSGQQEILLKVKTLKQALAETDYILFDEPETSLHPRWQRIIIKFVREVIKDNHGHSPQLFISTHSEKVLESLINDVDTLIVRLSKKDGAPTAERIEEMNLYLPKATFSELDCVVFGVETFEYHDSLLSYIGTLTNNVSGSIKKLDEFIERSHLYQSEIHQKTWINSYFDEKGTKRETVYQTLPIYIRNFFHHPKEEKGANPKEDELHCSILLLRDIIESLKNEIDKSKETSEI